METLQIINRELKRSLETPLKRQAAVNNKCLKWKMLAFLIVIGFKANAQIKEHINYILPDIVKQKISYYLKDSKSVTRTYGILNRQNDTTFLIICTYSKSSKELSYLIDNSNRFINIDDNMTIPIILNSDIVLSDRLHIIKNKGTENEIMSNTSIHASGYLIIYKGIYWNASIVKAEYYEN